MAGFFVSSEKARDSPEWNFHQIKLPLDIHTSNQQVFWEAALIYFDGSILLVFQSPQCWWPLQSLEKCWQTTGIRKIAIRNRLYHNWRLLYELRYDISWIVCLWSAVILGFGLELSLNFIVGLAIKELNKQTQILNT